MVIVYHTLCRGAPRRCTVPPRDQIAETSWLAKLDPNVVSMFRGVTELEVG